MTLFRLGLKNIVRMQRILPSISMSRKNTSSDVATLKTVLREKILAERQKVAQFRSKHGSDKVGEVTVNMMYGGMRGLNALICETSLLDPEEGISFRGYSLPACQKLLPRAKNGNEVLPEGMFWLLATGEIPTDAQVSLLSEDLAARTTLPEHVVTMLNNLPCTLHPMAQFSAAVTLLHSESEFQKAYSMRVPKLDLWEHALEDALNLIARVPMIAAIIYTNVFKDTSLELYASEELDWAANFCAMLGFDSYEFVELMRLYLTIHCDHEGGNVSAHATHLVGSALSDPYLAFAAGLNGLAGPLHGLANQESLTWLEKVRDDLGDDIHEDDLKEYVVKHLKSGRVVPGFGHAVLRRTDPRYTYMREFALEHLPHDPMFRLVSALYTVVPPILTQMGKTKNPWPNVDAHSGVLLQHYGMKETTYYTVLFGVSRALGVMAQYVWSRALAFPIERPKSFTTDYLVKIFQEDKQHCAGGKESHS